MPERGSIKLKIERGATVAEFGRFLVDLENAYLALYLLPTHRFRFRRRYIFEYRDPEFFEADWHSPSPAPQLIYPDDQLVLSRISIQSPGWAELIGSLNPLQQLREYLKDRHERGKDQAWRGDSEKDRAHWENEVLRHQAEREKIGVIRDYASLLDEIGLSPEERQRILWERLGIPLMRLGSHQDTGLLGDQRGGDSPGD